MADTNGGPPRHIFIIRHGEKPPHDEDVLDDPSTSDPPYGVDVEGRKNEHSLIPRGWQRSGALAGLFDPAVGPIRVGLAVPGHLFCPSYEHEEEGKTINHRTYQTILALSNRLNIKIVHTHVKGKEKELAAEVVKHSKGVLICWEHKHIPDLASAIANPGVVPKKWCDDRFDIIWRFTLSAVTDRPKYEFSQIPQLLLRGDSDKPIPPTSV